MADDAKALPPNEMKITPPSGKVGLLGILVLVSGFCGISYEILLARILSNLVGDQFTVSGAVLLTFLLGIGIGAVTSHRLWNFLWLIEAGIGLCGVAFALGSPWLDQLLYAQNGALLPLCVLLLLLPSFLIGASLPIFAGWMQRLAPASTFSLSYILYNFGAALMVLLAEFGLVRWFGLRAATLSVASLNGVVALLLLTCFSRPPALPSFVKTGSDSLPWGKLVALILAGIASAIFQLTMVRVAECLMGPFRETFAFVLALILAGIALGSFCVRRLHWTFAGCMVVNLLALIWLLAGLPQLMQLYAAGYAEVARWPMILAAFKMLVLAGLMLVPAMGFGATIPAILGNGRENESRTSGRLLFYTSLANAVGFGLMVSWLHLKLDYGELLLVVIALAALALVVGPGGRIVRAASVVLMLTGIVVQRQVWDEGLLYIGHQSFRSPQSLQAKWAGVDATERYKGHRESFSITRYNGDPYFFTNGFISIPLHAPSEKLVGAFSSIHAPRTDRALVLGVGSGATAGTTCKLFEKTDAVEINQVVLDNLHRMKAYNFDIQADPNVRIFNDDGVHFVKSGTERYSLVINTVTNPLYFTSSKLYTVDFYSQIKQRMTPDAVYTTTFDSTIGEEGVDIMLRTALASFQHVAVGCIKGSYYILLCSDKPIQPQQPRLIADHPWMGRFFQKEYDLRPEWIPYSLLLLDAEKLMSKIQGPKNTLDQPVLEFAMARLESRGYPAFAARVESQADPEAVAQAFDGLIVYNSHHHLLYLESLIGQAAATRGLKKKLEADPSFAASHREAELQEVKRLALEGEAATVFFRYGNKLKSRGDYAAAIEQYMQALEKNPAMTEVYLELGACYEYQGRLDEALSHYQKLVSQDAETVYRIGRVYVKQLRYPEAVKQLKLAKQKRPEDLSIQMYLDQAEEGVHAGLKSGNQPY